MIELCFYKAISSCPLHSCSLKMCLQIDFFASTHYVFTVLGFHFCTKIFERNQLKGGKIYFWSWISKFSSMGTWLSCFWVSGEAEILTERIWLNKLPISWWSGEGERDHKICSSVFPSALFLPIGSSSFHCLVCSSQQPGVHKP